MPLITTVERLIDRAKAVNRSALVITPDAQIVGQRQKATMEFCRHTDIDKVDQNILLPGTF